MKYRTMVRQVKSDLEALLMCHAFEAAGGEAFSVVFVAEHKTVFAPHLSISPTWDVFGRADDPDKVDEAFARLLDDGQDGGEG